MNRRDFIKISSTAVLTTVGPNILSAKKREDKSLDSFSAGPYIFGDMIVSAKNGKLQARTVFQLEKELTSINPLDIQQTLRWEKATPTQNVAAIQFCHNSLFLLACPSDFGGQKSTQNSLVVLDFVNGEIRKQWESISQAHVSIHSIHLIKDLLLIVDNDGKINAYDARLAMRRQLRWEAELPGKFPDGSSPIEAAEDAIFYTTGEKAYAFDASGRLRWESEVREAPDDEDNDRNLIFERAISPVLTQRQMIVFSKEPNAKLTAFHRQSGKVSWQIDLPSDQLEAIVTHAPEELVAITLSDRIIVLDGISGSKLLEKTLSTLKQDHSATEPIGTLLVPAIEEDYVTASHEFDREISIFFATSTGHLFTVQVSRKKDRGRLEEGVPKITYFKFVESSIPPAKLLIGNGYIFYTSKNYDYPLVKFPEFQKHTAALRFPDIEATGISLPNLSFGTSKEADFSIECWVRTSVGGEVLTQAPDSNGGGFRLVIGNKKEQQGVLEGGQGTIQFIMGDSTQVYVCQVLHSEIANGYWHHLAVVKNKGKIAIYADGIQQALYTEAEKDQAVRLGSKNPLTLGAYTAATTDLTTHPFEGLIHDLRIWNIALTADRILDHKDLWIDDAETGLIAHWVLSSSFNSLENKVAGSAGASQSATVNRAVLTNLRLQERLFPHITHVDDEQYHWAVNTGEQINEIIHAQEVICLIGAKSLWAVDRTNGRRLWSVEKDEIREIKTHNDLLFLYFVQSTTSHFISAIDSNSGVEIWQKKLEDAFLFELMPATGDLVVVSASKEELIQAFSMSTGEKKWSQKNTDLALSEAGKIEAVNHFGKPEVCERTVCHVRGPWLISIQIGADGKEIKTRKWSKSDGITSDFWLGKSIALTSNRIVVVYKDEVIALDSSTLEQSAAWNKTPAEIKKESPSSIEVDTDSNRLVIWNSYSFYIYDLVTGGTPLFTSFSVIDGLKATGLIPSIKDILGNFLLHQDKLWFTATSLSIGTSSSLYTPWPIQLSLDIRSGEVVYLTTHEFPDWGNNELVELRIPKWYIADETIYLAYGPYATAINLVDNYAIQYQPTGSNSQLDLASTLGKLTANYQEINPSQNGLSICAWVKTKQGGEITKLITGNNELAFRLAITSSGSISTEIGLNGTCYKVSTAANTEAADGQWHHITVSLHRSNNTETTLHPIIHLNSEELQLAPVETGTTIPTWNTGAQKQLYLGGSPSQTFGGALYQVSLWANARSAEETRSQMHLLPKGDEAGLLACWNASKYGWHDIGPLHLDPDTGRGRATITHLPILKTISPSIHFKSEEIGTDDQGRPKNNIRLSLHKGDGPPMQAKVKIYCNQPAILKTDTEEKEVSDVEKDYLEVTPIHNGLIDLEVISKQKENIVSEILVWGDWMPPKERAHFSPYHGEKNTKKAEEHLHSQVSLIQDFDFHQNDKDADDKEKSNCTSYLVRLIAQNSYGVPLPRRRVKIWSASDPCTIILHNQQLQISSDNPAEVLTGSDGIINLTLDAKQGLKTPALLIWADFYPHSQRVKVDPVHDPLNKLAEVTSDQLTGKAPLIKEKPARAILPAQYTTAQADAIAAKIRGLAGNASGDQPMLKGNRHGYGASAQTDAPAQENLNSRITALKHVHDYLHPVDGIRSEVISIRNATQNSISRPHFTGGIALNFKNRSISALTPPNLEGLISGDSGSGPRFAAPAGISHWVHGLETAVSKAVRKVSEIAETVAEHPVQQVKKAYDDIKKGNLLAAAAEMAQVTPLFVEADAITTTIDNVILRPYFGDSGTISLESRFHGIEVIAREGDRKIHRFIVSTMHELHKLIHDIFEGIGVAIGDLVQWLRDIFDWENILQYQKLIQEIGAFSRDLLHHSFDEILDELKKDIDDIGDKLKALLGAPNALRTTGFSGIAAATKHHADKREIVNAGTSVKGNFILSKFQVTQRQGTAKVDQAAITNENGYEDTFHSLGSTIASLADGITHDGSVFTEIVKGIKSLLIDIIDGIIKLTDELIDDLKKLIEQLVRFIDTEPQYILLITDLYKWATGEDKMTLNGLFSLILAIPANIALTSLSYVDDKIPRKLEEKYFTKFKEIRADAIPDIRQPIPSIRRRAAVMETSGLGCADPPSFWGTLRTYEHFHFSSTETEKEKAWSWAEEQELVGVRFKGPLAADTKITLERIYDYQNEKGEKEERRRLLWSVSGEDIPNHDSTQMVGVDPTNFSKEKACPVDKDVAFIENSFLHFSSQEDQKLRILAPDQIIVILLVKFDNGSIEELKLSSSLANHQIFPNGTNTQLDLIGIQVLRSSFGQLGELEDIKLIGTDGAVETIIWNSKKGDFPGVLKIGTICHSFLQEEDREKLESSLRQRWHPFFDSLYNKIAPSSVKEVPFQNFVAAHGRIFGIGKQLVANISGTIVEKQEIEIIVEASSKYSTIKSPDDITAVILKINVVLSGLLKLITGGLLAFTDGYDGIGESSYYSVKRRVFDAGVERSVESKFVFKLRILYYSFALGYTLSYAFERFMLYGHIHRFKRFGGSLADLGLIINLLIPIIRVGLLIKNKADGPQDWKGVYYFKVPKFDFKVPIPGALGLFGGLLLVLDIYELSKNWGRMPKEERWDLFAKMIDDLVIIAQVLNTKKVVLITSGKSPLILSALDALGPVASTAIHQSLGRGKTIWEL